MSKIIFVIDWKSAKEFNISKELAEFGKPVMTLCMSNASTKDYTTRYRYPILVFKYLQLAFRALKHADKDDTIVNWNFTIGFCCCLLRFFSKRKPKIVCLNIIAHESTGITGFIRKHLFSFFLNNDLTYITANSNKLFSQYTAEFKISGNNMFELEDPILNVYERRSFEESYSYIFCGGVAKRDWETYFKACALLPEHQFIGVASKNGFPKHLHIPDNVDMHFDVPLDTFNQLLKGATMQVLPLASSRPAGLIGLITGAMLSIPIITTRTPSMENYIIHGENGMLVQQGDGSALASAIKLLYSDAELRKSQVTLLQKHIEANFSEKAYSKKLFGILKKIDTGNIVAKKPVLT